MDDEKLFQYLVSRVQLRETSTLTVASIASSSSLILLGLFFSSVLPDINKEVFRLIGIFTPILGFAYFEIIFATQQSWDYHEITMMIRKNSKRGKDNLDKIIYGKIPILVIPKGILWRVLLSLPIIGWASIDGNNDHIVISIVLTIIVISLLVLRVELKKRDEKSKSKNDDTSQDTDSN